jgi:ribosomal protein L40E
MQSEVAWSALDICFTYPVTFFSFFGAASTTELVSVQPFKPHVCVDCGAKLSKFGAVRCKECNMRKVGKPNRRKRRKQK